MKMDRKTVKCAALCMVICLGLVLAGCGGKKKQTATLELPSNPTTGYEWQAIQDKDLFDISGEYVEDKKDKDIVGAGGKQIFTLTPKAEGVSEITFSYLQPWEGGETGSVLRYQVKVDENMQIEVLSVKGQIDAGIVSVPETPEMQVK